MGIVTTRIGVTLTATELEQLDTLRLIFGPKVTRPEALRRLIRNRYLAATTPPPVGSKSE